jgi:SAM-dependent methyltransferase
MSPVDSYLMENVEEAIRLEIKTDTGEVRKQAVWCGMKPGLRVLDAGCGPGKITSVLCDMIQPGGSILGIDYSERRIRHARENYGNRPCIDFQIHDLRNPLDSIGLFDIIWVRFVLEYNLAESAEIVKNLTACLKPDGCLCLLDLDHNCLNHYELPARIESVLFRLMDELERKHNFDPYSGRKLYSYLYDLGYRDIELDFRAHHLFYGKMKEENLFNWLKKMEMASIKATDLFERYPGGLEGFSEDFMEFFLNPRRFTYTPLILCKGRGPLSR